MSFVFPLQIQKPVNLSFRITVSTLKHDYYYWHELSREIIQSYLFGSYSCICSKMLDHLFRLFLSMRILSAIRNVFLFIHFYFNLKINKQTCKHIYITEKLFDYLMDYFGHFALQMCRAKSPKRSLG